MPLKEKETKLCENILNWLVSCFLHYGNFTAIGKVLHDFSPLRETRTKSALIKRSPVFDPCSWWWSGHIVTGHSSTSSTSWCQMWGGMTRTDSQSGGVVYLGKDLWRSRGLAPAQRKTNFKVK